MWHVGLHPHFPSCSSPASLKDLVGISYLPSCTLSPHLLPRPLFHSAVVCNTVRTYGVCLCLATLLLAACSPGARQQLKGVGGVIATLKASVVGEQAEAVRCPGSAGSFAGSWDPYLKRPGDQVSPKRPLRPAQAQTQPPLGRSCAGARRREEQDPDLSAVEHGVYGGR